MCISPAMGISSAVAFDTADDKNAFMAVTAATSLTFFAMVGFEDSVNMAEETKDPVKIFPKMLLTGLSIVSIVAVALVPVGELEASDTPLAEVVKAGGSALQDADDPAGDWIPHVAVSRYATVGTAVAALHTGGHSDSHRHRAVSSSPWRSTVRSGSATRASPTRRTLAWSLTSGAPPGSRPVHVGRLRVVPLRGSVEIRASYGSHVAAGGPLRTATA